MENRRTTRERIADRLRAETETVSSLATRFGISRQAALDHVRHVARSLRDETESVLVRPPSCRDCGFEDFDDPLNLPSRCPECKSEAIDEPAVTIDADQ
ncbi:MAG: transcriptional regulator [Halanaeroarchaeum sp.]